jgi:hypothetical protein
MLGCLCFGIGELGALAALASLAACGRELMRIFSR